MRRLPIYFLVDVSESMVGEPIQQVEKGMRHIIQTLCTDPYALETAYASVIAFSDKATSLSPLTELEKFYIPKFPLGGEMSLGTALDFLMDDIDKNAANDFGAVIFLFINGIPKDNLSSCIKKWEEWRSKYYYNAPRLVAISISNNINAQGLSSNGTCAVCRKAQNPLKGLANAIFTYDSLDSANIGSCFLWTQYSIRTIPQGDQAIDTSDFPEPPEVNIII